MKPPALRYLAPRSLEEAHAVFAKYGDEARPLAGGQSLIAMLNLRLAAPEVLIDLRCIPNLHRIEHRGDAVCVGAAVTQAQLEDDRAISDLPLIAEMLPHVAHREIRNAGTIVGSLAHADPAAELPTAAVTLGADLVVNSQAGERVVPARDVYAGYLTTVLRFDEIITEVRFPAVREGVVSAFQEVAPRRGDYALAGVAVQLRNVDGVVTGGDVGLLGLATTPLHVDVTDLVSGSSPDTLPIDDVASRVIQVVDPKSDVHADAGYRRYLARVLTSRVLKTVLTRSA